MASSSIEPAIEGSGNQRVNSAVFHRWINEIRRRFFTEAEDTLPDFEFLGQGFIKGFLLWFIPMLVLRRKLDAWRRALALGVFVTSVRGLSRLEAKAATILNPRSPAVRLLFNYANALKGVISGSLFLLIDKDLHKNSILVFWILVRSFYNLVPAGIPYGSTIVMCISTGWLLSTWIMNPHEMNRTYEKFLSFQGDIRPADRDLVIYRQRQGDHIQHDCFLMHPPYSCEEYAGVFFLDSLIRASTVYVPLHLTIFMLTKHKSIPNLIENLVRSMLFLATYCTLGWYSACFYSRYFPGITRFSLACHTWVAGLATLIEREQRRSELANYCFTYALDSVFMTLKNTEFGKDFKLPGRSLLLLSLGILGHFHEQQPAFLTGWLFRLKREKQKKEQQ